MPRLSRSRLVAEFAAALLVVFTAVSIADIDDYDVHPRASSPAFVATNPASGSPEMLPETDDPESGRDHACSCLLCVTILSSAFGPRILPLSAGTLAQAPSSALALPAHTREVFHPPCA